MSQHSTIENLPAADTQRTEGFLASIQQHGDAVAAACRRTITALPLDATFSPMEVLSDAFSSTGTIQSIDEQALGAMRFNSAPTCRYRDGRRRESVAIA